MKMMCDKFYYYFESLHFVDKLRHCQPITACQISSNLMALKEKCYSSRESSVFTYLLHDVFVINVTNDVINYDNVIRIHS